MCVMWAFGRSDASCGKEPRTPESLGIDRSDFLFVRQPATWRCKSGRRRTTAGTPAAASASTDSPPPLPLTDSPPPLPLHRRHHPDCLARSRGKKKVSPSGWWPSHPRRPGSRATCLPLRLWASRGLRDVRRSSLSRPLPLSKRARATTGEWRRLASSSTGGAPPADKHILFPV